MAALIAQGRVTLDGVRLRPSAGAASFPRRLTLEEYLVETGIQVQALRADLDADPAETTRRHRQAQARTFRERSERVAQALAQLAAMDAKKKSC